MAVKDLKYAALLDCYGKLLSPKQRYAAELYFCDDLSLSEIAEHMEITRQGVRDQILHAQEIMDGAESSLHIYKKETRLREILNDISAAAQTTGASQTITQLCEQAGAILDSEETEADKA